MPRMRICLVGAGRLGSWVRARLEAAGVEVTTVHRGEAIPSSPVTWILVPDREIAEVARSVPPGGVVMHASGATGIDTLRPHHPAAILHPVMTFPPGGPTSDRIPATIAGDDEAISVCEDIARALEWQAVRFEGDRRLYHAACVVAGNFATTLLAEAAEILVEAGVSREDATGLLSPLAVACLQAADELGPSRALTGPVARGDEATIAAHREALRTRRPEALALYEALLLATRRIVEHPGE